MIIVLAAALGMIRRRRRCCCDGAADGAADCHFCAASAAEFLAHRADKEYESYLRKMEFWERQEAR
jgi:hypothetical protein